MKGPYSINIQGLAHGCVDPHFADEYGERLILCFGYGVCLFGWMENNNDMHDLLRENTKR